MREQASGGNRADTNQVDETGTGPNTKTQKHVNVTLGLGVK